MELLCVSLQVNLELAHLAKLSPPVAGNGSVAPDRAGRYFNGYQRIVDELIDAAGAGRVAHTFTPHIHRDWHKPGILPEIAEGVTRHLVRDVNRAIMAALVSGALRFDQSHGQRIAEVSTVGRVPTGSISLIIANSHDVFETVRAFERHPEAVRACLNLWQHEMQRLSRVADARELPLAQALEAGTALDTVLRIAESRRDEELRDDRVIGLVAGHCHLIGEEVGVGRPDLPERARRETAERLAIAANAAALERVRGAQTPETFRKAEVLFGKGLERWRGR